MGIQERAGCQVPPVADWAKGQYSGGPLRIVSGLAENTNSIICDGSGEPETANGCPVLHRMRGPSAVRHSCATLNPDQSNARSRERAQRPRAFFLTLTYMEVGFSEMCSFRLLLDDWQSRTQLTESPCLPPCRWLPAWNGPSPRAVDVGRGGDVRVPHQVFLDAEWRTVVGIGMGWSPPI